MYDQNPMNVSYRRREPNVVGPFNFYLNQTVEVPGGSEDVSLRDTLLPSAFARFNTAIELLIRDSTGNFSFRLNSVEEDAIDVPTGAVWQQTNYPISDILVSASGTMTFKLFLQGW